MNEINQKWIRFADNVTLRELNKNDVALKCPYMNNLFATSMQILPLMNEVVSNLFIVRGFESEKKQKYDKSVVTEVDKLFSKGLAIELSWPNYKPDVAIEYCKDLIERIGSDDFNIVVTPISIVYHYDKESRALVQEFEENKKTIRRVIIK